MTALLATTLPTWPAAPARHFLTIDGLRPDGLRALLDLAVRLKLRAARMSRIVA